MRLFDKIRKDLIMALAGNMPVVLNMRIAPGIPGCDIVNFPNTLKPWIFCSNEISGIPSECILIPIRDAELGRSREGCWMPSRLD